EATAEQGEGDEQGDTEATAHCGARSSGGEDDANAASACCPGATANAAGCCACAKDRTVEWQCYHSDPRPQPLRHRAPGRPSARQSLRGLRASLPARHEEPEGRNGTPIVRPQARCLRRGKRGTRARVTSATCAGSPG